MAYIPIAHGSWLMALLCRNFAMLTRHLRIFFVTTNFHVHSGNSAQIKSWLEQVDDRISMVEDGQIRTEQATTQRLAGIHAELDSRLAALRADVDTRVTKELGQIEFNCSAAMGEMVSAGIEQISASSVVTGMWLSETV